MQFILITQPFPIGFEPVYTFFDDKKQLQEYMEKNYASLSGARVFYGEEIIFEKKMKKIMEEKEIFDGFSIKAT